MTCRPMQILITVITWPSRWRAAGDMVCLATPVLPRPFFAGVVASLSEHGGLSSDLTPKVMSDLVVVGQKSFRMEIEHLGISWFQWENDNTPICTSGFRGSTRMAGWKIHQNGWFCWLENLWIQKVYTRPGELTFCYGKIHHFSWENPL